MKHCTVCKCKKDHSEFRKDKRRKGGLSNQCKSCHVKISTRSYYNNHDKRLAYAESYRENNKESCNRRVSDWAKRNRERRAYREASRRVRKMQACPSWADTELIELIYMVCEPGYHVDHIVPLKGENVCGLHVENNLQYLLAIENVRKSNKF